MSPITNIKAGTEHLTRAGCPETCERGTVTLTACGIYTGDHPAHWADGDLWLGAVKCKRCQPEARENTAR